MVNYRSDNLDLLRGIGMLIVVIGHAIQISILDGQGSFLWERVILVFQMPFLFLISGYCAGFSFPTTNICRVLKKKVLRLFLPYCAWAFVYYLITFVCNESIQTSFTLSAIFEELFSSDFWFLRHLFVYFCIISLSNLVVNLFKISNRIFIFSLCIGASTGIVWLLRNSIVLNQTKSIQHYMWFLVGYLWFQIVKYVKVHDQVSFNRVKRKWNIYVKFFVGVIVLLSIIYIIKYPCPEYVACSVYILCCTYCVCVGKRFIPKKAKEFLKGIGTNTLPIYAIHWCLLFAPFLAKGYYKVFWSGVPAFIKYSIITILWLVICYGIMTALKMFTVTKVIFLGLEGKRKNE